MKFLQFSFKKRDLKYPLILAGIFLLIFLPVFFTGFSYDDYPHIVNNSLLRKESPLFFLGNSIGSPQGDNFFTFYYRPIPFLTFSILFKFFGLSPIFFHLVQMGIFLADVLLVFFLFSSIFTEGLAFILALTFLVHPINQTLSAYIGDLLYTYFLFFGLLALAVWRKKMKVFKKALFSSLFLLFAFLSNEAGLLFVPILLVYAKMTGKVRLKYFLGPLFLSGVIYLLLRNLSYSHYFTRYLPSHAMMEPLTTRILHVPVFIYYYLMEIFAPRAAVPRVKEIILNPPNLILLTIFFLSLFGSLFLFFKYLRKNQSKRLKWFTFFTFWFFWGLSLYVQIIPLDTYIARRFLSFSLIGVLGIGGVLVSEAPFIPQKYKRLLLWLYLVFLLVLSLQTIKSNLSLMEWRLHLVEP